MTKSFRSEPPTLEAVIAYAEEINSPSDPLKFYLHYSNKEWRTRDEPIRDWKALFRYWTAEDRKKPKQTVSAAEYHARMKQIDPEKLKYICEVFGIDYEEVISQCTISE